MRYHLYQLTLNEKIRLAVPPSYLFISRHCVYILVLIADTWNEILLSKRINLSRSSFKFHNDFRFKAGCVIPNILRLTVLPRKSNGVNVYKVGSKVRFSCDSGYVIKGALRSQCQSNGKWTTKIPTCGK